MTLRSKINKIKSSIAMVNWFDSNNEAQRKEITVTYEFHFTQG